MTRNDIIENYTVDEYGIILTAGMFEGEMIYAPYFWDAYLDGMADEDDGHKLTFYINEQEVVMFPELEGRDRISFYQRDDGFVCEC
jgi:hypothetical protein